jgi:hypothetical protein
MALTVKRITLWRREAQNEPGVLASTLEPLARAGADLRLVMGYRFPEATSRAAIEVYPVSGKKVAAGAEAAGLRAFDLACLLVEGDNRPGLGAAIARALAESGVNIAFLVAHVIGRRFVAAVGFESEAALAQAAPVIKAAARPPRAARRR